MKKHDKQQTIKDELSILIKDLNVYLEKLNTREKYALTKRYDLDGLGFQTWRQIGEYLDVSRERARQICAKAFRRIIFIYRRNNPKKTENPIRKGF